MEGEVKRRRDGRRQKERSEDDRRDFSLENMRLNGTKDPRGFII